MKFLNGKLQDEGQTHIRRLIKRRWLWFLKCKSAHSVRQQLPEKRGANRRENIFIGTTE